MPPVAATINRIPGIWGTADLIEARPDLTVWENAVYLPNNGTDRHRVVPAHRGGNGIEVAPDGFYILIDNMTGHYGHFIVDVLSRLWPVLDERRSPVRILCEPENGRPYWERYPFIGEILAGLDLGFETVVSFETAVILPWAAVAAPSFHELQRFHAVFGDLCRRAGRRYWGETGVDVIARPAYLSKARLTYGMHCLVNEDEVVAELDRLGVDILYPEEMSFAEQVRQFASRRVLMGPVGSAFHTAAFSAPARRIIGLSALLPLNSNYVMFDAVNQNRAYYYYVRGTTHGSKDGFGLAWTVPEPKAVAAQLLMRAENFDRIDACDAAVEIEQARRWRSLAARTGRLRDRIAARWQQFTSYSDRRPP